MASVDIGSDTYDAFADTDTADTFLAAAASRLAFARLKPSLMPRRHAAFCSGVLPARHLASASPLFLVPIVLLLRVIHDPDRSPSPSLGVPHLGAGKRPGYRSDEATRLARQCHQTSTSSARSSCVHSACSTLAVTLLGSGLAWHHASSSCTVRRPLRLRSSIPRSCA